MALLTLLLLSPVGIDWSLVPGTVDDDARQDEGHPGQHDQVSQMLGRVEMRVAVRNWERDQVCADIEGQPGHQGDRADPHDERQP
jgi:hypothetical protein